ncbi:hypothetical protein [Ornithinimicrobium sp. LYQ103]
MLSAVDLEFATWFAAGAQDGWLPASQDPKADGLSSQATSR